MRHKGAEGDDSLGLLIRAEGRNGLPVDQRSSGQQCSRGLLAADQEDSGAGDGGQGVQDEDRQDETRQNWYFLPHRRAKKAEDSFLDQARSMLQVSQHLIVPSSLSRLRWFINNSLPIAITPSRSATRSPLPAISARWWVPCVPPSRRTSSASYSWSGSSSRRPHTPRRSH